MDPSKSCPKTLGYYYKEDADAKTCLYEPSGTLTCGLTPGQTGEKVILQKDRWDPHLSKLVQEQNKPWNVARK